MYSKHTGIILKKYPLGEADELLTIYTKDVGKLRVKAVSARKIQSRLAGNLQSLNEIEFEVAGRTLPVLISVRARTINNYLREDLKKFAAALVGIETLYRLTPDRQENEEAYKALVVFLKNLGESNNEDLEVRAFQTSLLNFYGYAIPAEKCLNCGLLLDQIESVVSFSSEKGGLFCPRCSSAERVSARLTPGDLRSLKGFLTDQNLTENLSREIENVIDGFISFVLEREIKSARFLHSI